MKSFRVAKRYARALLEVAPRDQAEKWGAELERLAKMIESPELMVRLASPELPQEAREQALQKIAERLNLSFPLRSFAVVIARHGRIDAISAVSQSYQNLLDEQLGRERATLTFAIQPDDGTVQRVVSGLEAIASKKIIPTIKIDPALLGGVMAELGGKIYDGSLATRLTEAQQRLAG
jgi:F-type H+-transporting ATPase subunit delta